MAHAVYGSIASKRRSLVELRNANYKYAYPPDLDLKPDSELHDYIRDRILERAQDSSSFLSTRFDSWREIDKVLTAYIRADDAEEELKERDERKPISIVFPNTYAILETILSYMSMAFFQNPIFRYVGVGPEDTVGAILLQHVIQQQCERSKVLLNLHTMFRDAFAYGIGAIHPFWDVRTGSLPRVTETGEVDFTGETVSSSRMIEFVSGQILSEGNALRNIDPYLMLPDPNTSIHDLQGSEYFGWISHYNLMTLLSREQNDKEMFNARYLKHVGDGRTSVVEWEPSDRGRKTGLERDRNSDNYSTPVDTITMFIRLIPEEWKLGSGEYPEVWMFELGADNVVLKAQPENSMHGMIPVAVAAPEYDGYGITPISRLETQFGLQGVLDWLFNSHIANVRKAMNDMLVVDPYMVNIKDLQNPGPGKLIRLRRPMWGQGVKNAVQQLAVNDITRGNMADASFIVKMMQQLSGSDSPMMGALREGGPERLTSAEFQGTRTGSVSRLERIARIISSQAMQDIGRMFASNTIQLMERSTYVSSVGQWPEVLRRRYPEAALGAPLQVTPFDLVVDYDVNIRDGSIPGGNFSEAWLQLYQMILANPETAQRFDTVRIFKHIASNLGAKNVDEFEKQQEPQQNLSVQPQLMSDENTMREVERGNLVDVGEL